MQDLLKIFERLGVEYALVGGYAVNFYGYSRATQDLDILVNPSVSNAVKVMAALDEFGFGGAGIPKEYFEREGSAIHLGVEPNRIDLLTTLDSVPNERLFKNRVRGTLGPMTVSIIALKDLIEVKRLSKRTRDRADAEELDRISEGPDP